MSADNWGECPKCETQRQADIVALSQKSSDSYGKVSVDAFDAMRQELADLLNNDMDATLREDYEFYLDPDTGVFEARYSARCTECGWSFKFNHEEKAL